MYKINYKMYKNTFDGNRDKILNPNELFHTYGTKNEALSDILDYIRTDISNYSYSIFDIHIGNNLIRFTIMTDECFFEKLFLIINDYIPRTPKEKD